jgi:hypothetical protein
MKDTVHVAVHRSVHLFGERTLSGAQQEIPPVRAVRIWAKQVQKVGITYFNFVFTIFFTL